MRAAIVLPSLLAAGLIGGQGRGRLASDLEAGMQLQYEAEGQAQPPWSIDSVRLDVPLKAGSQCAVVHLRRQPDQAQSEENRLCLANDTLYRWDAKRGAWGIARPTGRRMSWLSTQPSGDIVRYDTGETAQDTVSGRVIPVVHTTVTTSDSTGRPKRRLRERYAVSLTTATGGSFELPDSTQAGGWQPQRRFELREIRPKVH